VAWEAKEAVRELYGTRTRPRLEWVDALVDDLTDAQRPPEVRSLGRTLRRWRLPITAWHACHLTNGPTEAMNNLIKRVKRVAFGFTNFRNYRVRALLYAGKPTGHCSRASALSERDLDDLRRGRTRSMKASTLLLRSPNTSWVQPASTHRH